MGDGIFKFSDGGQTFTQLASINLVDNGGEYSYFYGTLMTSRYNAFSAVFADFNGPLELYEDLDDKNSIDSLELGADTLKISIDFANGINLEIRSSVVVRYDAGAIINLESLMGEIPLLDSLTVALEPGQSVKFHDPVQSIFAVGLTAFNDAGQPSTMGGGVWMARDVLISRTAKPGWRHIGALADGEISSSMVFSGDGDLPFLPVSDAVFNYNDPHNGQVILGTDLGLFTTNDITASSVSWAVDNSGYANMPVFDLLQTRTVRYNLLHNQDLKVPFMLLLTVEKFSKHLLSQIMWASRINSLLKIRPQNWS